jgi:hypothetical protein
MQQLHMHARHNTICSVDSTSQGRAVWNSIRNHANHQGNPASFVFINSNANTVFPPVARGHLVFVGTAAMCPTTIASCMYNLLVDSDDDAPERIVGLGESVLAPVSSQLCANLHHNQQFRQYMDLTNGSMSPMRLVDGTIHEHGSFAMSISRYIPNTVHADGLPPIVGDCGGLDALLRVLRVTESIDDLFIEVNAVNDTSVSLLCIWMYYT